MRGEKAGAKRLRISRALATDEPYPNGHGAFERGRPDLGAHLHGRAAVHAERCGGRVVGRIHLSLRRGQFGPVGSQNSGQHHSHDLARRFIYILK